VFLSLVILILEAMSLTIRVRAILGSVCNPLTGDLQRQGGGLGDGGCGLMGCSGVVRASGLRGIALLVAE
jgi:hypothetical protein